MKFIQVLYSSLLQRSEKINLLRTNTPPHRVWKCVVGDAVSSFASQPLSCRIKTEIELGDFEKIKGASHFQLRLFTGNISMIAARSLNLSVYLFCTERLF